VADLSRGTSRINSNRRTCVTSRGRKFAENSSGVSFAGWAIGFRAFSLYLPFHGELGFIDGKFGPAGSRLSLLA